MVIQDIKLAVAKAVAKNATVYTDAMALEGSTGHIGLEIISTAGQVAISQQCSFDNSTWYDPVDGSGNAMGAVLAAQTVTAGKFVVVDVVSAPFIRYKIVEADVAATAVSIRICNAVG